MNLVHNLETVRRGLDDNALKLTWKYIREFLVFKRSMSNQGRMAGNA